MWRVKARCVLVVPVTWNAEAEGLLEPRSSRSAWATARPHQERKEGKEGGRKGGKLNLANDQIL
jgi:hypothetical protein